MSAHEIWLKVKSSFADGASAGVKGFLGMVGRGARTSGRLIATVAGQLDGLKGAGRAAASAVGGVV